MESGQNPNIGGFRTITPFPSLRRLQHTTTVSCHVHTPLALILQPASPRSSFVYPREAAPVVPSFASSSTSPPWRGRSSVDQPSIAELGKYTIGTSPLLSENPSHSSQPTRPQPRRYARSRPSRVIIYFHQCFFECSPLPGLG